MRRIWAYPIVHLHNTTTNFKTRINTVFNKTFICEENKQTNKNPHKESSKSKGLKQKKKIRLVTSVGEMEVPGKKYTFIHLSICI